MTWRFPEARTPAVALLAGWTVLLAAAPAHAAVQGRLVDRGGPVAGGVVEAFAGPDLAGPPVARSAPSAADGTYLLDLPPGRYHLAASAPGRWAYCGQNPVAVEAADQWVGFELVPWSEPVRRPLPGGGLEGRLVVRLSLDGQPVQGAAVSLYLDSADGFRGAGFLRSAPSGPDGTVVLDMVPDGTYFLLARRREGGEGVGPVLRGDLFAYYRHNPLRVAAGQEAEVSLPLVEKRRERDVNGQGVVGQEAGFAGRLADREGRPLAGLHVFAYREPEMGHQKPAAISSLSDADGRYRIFLPAPGRYFVGAREGYGDSPSPGEYYGEWRGSADHSLAVGEGEFRTGVDLTLRRVLEP